MATTIQVVDNLSVGRYIEIGGQRCEVEAVSFSQAITNGQANEAMMNAMANELIELKVIRKGEDGQYYFCEDGAPLVEDEDFED